MAIRAEVVTRRPQSLSASQQVAFAALTGGSSFREAAAAAGINRTTLYRWTRLDPLFRASYEAWKQATRESARGRLLAAAEASLSRVIDAMEVDARFAFRVINATGMFGGAGSTPVNVDRVRRQIELEQQEEECQIALRRARLADLRAKVIELTPGQAELPRLEGAAFQAAAGFEPADTVPEVEVVDPSEVETALRVEEAESASEERDNRVEPVQCVKEDDEELNERRRLAEIGNLTLLFGIAHKSAANTDKGQGEPILGAEPPRLTALEPPVPLPADSVEQTPPAGAPAALESPDVIALSAPSSAEDASSPPPATVEMKSDGVSNSPALAENAVNDADSDRQRKMQRMEEIHTLFQIQGDLLDEDVALRLMNEFETLRGEVRQRKWR